MKSGKTSSKLRYKGKKVLLLDGYGRQIPSLLHQLHELGCKVTTMCESRLDVGFTSRYPSRRIVVHGIREDVDIYRQAIEKELENGYDVLFPILEKSTDICTDGKISALYPGLKIIAAPREAFLKAYDKQQTMTACMKNGIPCPITKMDDETMDDFLSRVSFPLAAKPRKGSGSAGFKKIHTREELDQYIADGDIVPEEYVIQEFIPQDKYMCNCYVMMDDQQNPMYSLALKTYRWYPVDGGPGCFARTVDQPEVTGDQRTHLRRHQDHGIRRLHPCPLHARESLRPQDEAQKGRHPPGTGTQILPHRHPVASQIPRPLPR